MKSLKKIFVLTLISLAFGFLSPLVSAHPGHGATPHLIADRGDDDDDDKFENRGERGRGRGVERRGNRGRSSYRKRGRGRGGHRERGHMDGFLSTTSSTTSPDRKRRYGKKDAARQFISLNAARLQEQIVKGNGEHLFIMAKLMGCPGESLLMVGQVLQKEFSKEKSTLKQKPTFIQIRQTLQAHPVLGMVCAFSA